MRNVTVWLLIGSAAWGANCARTSVGFTPFTNAFPVSYKGFSVSLYPNGAKRPAAHETLGLQQAAQVTPRDVGGAPGPNGSIVLLSIGMSNTTMEFSAFVPLAKADARRDPRVLPVDGAVGGMTASIIQSPSAPYWQQVDARLQAAGVTANQVQVVWMKEADAGPAQGFPAYAQQLQREEAAVVRLLRGRFPNLKIVYLSNRIYGGYASSSLNPEPYAYESGFAVKWLIEQQIDGDPELSVAGGAAPWLAWGPDLWADGLTSRIDGLAWACADVRADDGTHPGPSALQKVAAMLLDFFHSDSTARPWYLAKQAAPAPAVAAVVNSAGWGMPVATGSLAALFGTNLATGAAQAAGFPLPRDLAGTRVEVDGAPALLYYVSPTQINFVVPVGGGQALTVVRNETASAPVNPGIVYWAPGLYTLDSLPTGPAAAEHADGSVIGPANPARRGETIQMFGTGLGFVNPLLLIAQPAPTLQGGGRRAG
ncbi:MAG: hypothetical protein LAQ30_29825, partial [Acidobacteriia bacterium]|nr:hypothetical protein [Terriglobia bacterium]